MFRSLFISVLLASPAAAESFVSDAFGILPETEMSSQRAAWAGLRDGTANSITAPEAPDAVLIFIGPKALTAGKDDGHATALAFDRHGNLVQGVEAAFTLETNQTLRAEMTDGIADVLFVPEPNAGTFAGGASIGSLQSPRALYRVTADMESVTPILSDVPRLQAEMFTTLSSAQLADQYGNPVEDGVGTALILFHYSGAATLISAPVREAQAEATILGRDIETGGSVTLRLGTTAASARFEVQRVDAAAAPGLQVWGKDDIGAIGVRLGPLATAEGYMVTDGSPVEIAVSAEGTDQVLARGWVQDGYFETFLRRPSADDTLTVTFKTAVGLETRKVTVGRGSPHDIRGAE